MVDLHNIIKAIRRNTNYFKMERRKNVDENIIPITPFKESIARVTVNYDWIMDEIRKRNGWLPNDIERVLRQLDEEQKRG